MARISDYEQDEDKPFGVGTFKLDDGSEYYIDDASRAREFLSSFANESDNIADRGSVDRQGEELSTKAKLENAGAKLAGMANVPNEPFEGIDTGPARSQRFLAGPGTGDDDSLMSAEPDEPNESREPAPTGAPPPSEEELQRSAVAGRVARAYQAVPGYKVTPGVDPRRMQAEGVPVDKSVTREGGLPTDEYGRQADDRTQAYLETNDAVRRQQEERENAAALFAAQQRKQALDLDQSNKTREAELARVETKYKEDRSWLEKESDSFFDKSKPDPNRLSKTRGVFGNIASMIAQFMGAYASVMTQSPNFAKQILDRKLDADIDAQVEEFKRGKMKMDSQMARMADRGMTLEQMKSALKIQQEKVVDRLAKASAAEQGTRESKAAYEVFTKERQERFVEAENKFRTEALGKTTVHADVVQPKAGGRVALSPLEAMRERAAYAKAENELGYEAAGGAPAERAEERSIKAGEVDVQRGNRRQDRQTKYAEGRAKVGPPANDAQNAWGRLTAIKEKYGHLPGVGTWDLLGPSTTLGEQRQKFLQAFGVEQAKVAGEVNQLLTQIRNSAVAANAGAQTEGDVGREVEALKGPNQSEEQILAGTQRLVQRATSPLTELDAAFEDVRKEQDEARDRAALDAYKRRKRRGLELKGEDY